MTLVGTHNQTSTSKEQNKVTYRGVTSTQFFYLSKSKSNSSQNYSSKSKSTDSKKLLK